MGKFWIGGGSRIWFDDEYVNHNGIFTLNFVNSETEGSWFNNGEYEVSCDLVLTDVQHMICYLTNIENKLVKTEKRLKG